MKKRIHIEMRSRFCRTPFTARERIQLYTELKYYEEHRCFSSTADLRIKTAARRMLRSSDEAVYEQRKQRLIEAIILDMCNDEKE